MKLGPPIPENSDVLEDIIEDIAQDAIRADRWVRIALRVLGPDFIELWEKAYFDVPQDQEEYEKFLASKEFAQLTKDLDRRIEAAATSEEE